MDILDEDIESIKQLLQGKLLPLRKEEETQILRFKSVRKSQLDANTCTSFLNFLEFGFKTKLQIISDVGSSLRLRYSFLNKFRIGNLPLSSETGKSNSYKKIQSLVIDVI